MRAFDRLRSQLRRGRLPGAALLALLAWSAATAATTPVASQQFRLVRSTPEEGARLTEPPAALRLWFSSTPEPSVTLVQLSGPEGQVELGEARLASEGSLIVPIVGDMPPGDYRVTWRASVGGGRPARGTVRFVLLER